MPPNSKSPNTLDIDTNIPLPEELVKRAKALIPNLRSRTERCEEERRIPQENLDEMLAAGLFNTMKPKRYGGYEMGWETLCDLTLAIAEGCCSTGWIAPTSFPRATRSWRDAAASRRMSQAAIRRASR